MKIYKLYHIFILLITFNQDFVASSNNKNNFFYNLNNKDKVSLNRILLVQNDNNFKEIIVSGRGKSVENAAMNAAQNALLMASPRYTKKRRVIIEKDTLINDDFDPKDSLDNYRESIYGFNQGSILSFKIIKTTEKNNYFSVVAIAKVKYGLNDQKYHPLFRPPKVSTKDLGKVKLFKIGTGSSEEQAIKHAIEQALIFVVGEKINTEKKLDELILDDFEEITSFIDNEIKQSNFYTKETLGELTSGYSEGYIESFNKINSYKIDGEFKVEAIIVIRNKTFSSYIDEKLSPSRIKIKNDN